MDLIHFQGLNCYHDCVISIANYFGINYSDAFYTLWSETDFRYDSYREIYLTKRMIENLEKMGAKIEYLSCTTREEANKSISLFHKGEYVIVGVDAFYIPWNQFYQIFHGPHYFIIQNVNKAEFPCVDPTYGKKNEHIPREEIAANAFEIIRVKRVEENPMQIEIECEAREILRTHYDTGQALITRIHNCVNSNLEDIILLAKHIDTMINNRYMYKFFLENHTSSYRENYLFFDKEYFSEWNAVKNGLYKVSLSINKYSLINNICNHLNNLIEKEISMATQMLHCKGGFNIRQQNREFR